jgi:hypothetical protein
MTSPYIYGMRFTVTVPEATFSIEAANQKEARQRALKLWHTLGYADRHEMNIAPDDQS